MAVEKIDLTDTETILHMRAFFRPHSWFIVNMAFLRLTDSSQFFIRDMNRIEFGKQVNLSESGEHSFKMIFPAIPEKTKKIDLVFMTEDNGFNIFGLSLDSKAKQTKETIPSDAQTWIKNELEQAKLQKMFDIDTEFFIRDTARLVGYIKGYNPRLGFSTGMVYASNDITREDYPIVIKIHEDGRFEGTIPMSYPQNLQVNFKSNWMPFYIEPGQTLSMVFNWNDFVMAERYRFKQSGYNFSNITFQGATADINTELTAFYAKLPELPTRILYNEQKTKEADEYKEFVKTTTANYTNRYNSLLNDEKLSNRARKILKDNYQIEFATFLMDYDMNRRFEGKRQTSDFYNFLQDIQMNDKELLSTPQFKIFINRFEFAGIFNANRVYHFDKEMSHEEMKIEMEKQDLERNDSIYIKELKLTPGIVYDVTKIRRLDFTFGQMMKDQKEGAEKFLTYLKENIQEPFLKEEAERIFNKNYPSEGHTAYELPDTKEAKIFKDIITKHKGKILLVDFWATSCGPCVGSIKDQKGLREKYKESNDAAFIFITSENESPLQTYNDFVKEQELEHSYRISTNDFRSLRQLFRFNGIPKYIIVDREGRIWKENASSYSFETDLEEMLELEKEK